MADGEGVPDHKNTMYQVLGKTMLHFHQFQFILSENLLLV